MKHELKEIWKNVDFPFYLAFPTGIYLSNKQKGIVQNMSKVKLKINFVKLNV